MTLHVYFRQRQDVLNYCTMPMSGKLRFLWYSASEQAETLRPHNFQSEVAQGGVSLVFGIGKG